MSVKIFFKEEEEGQDEGKAKGAWVEEENENEAPEFIGLSKKQFFCFLLAAILLGAGTFGVGYTLAYFKKEQANAANKKKSAISLNKEQIKESANNGVSMVPGSSFVSYPGSQNNGEGAESAPPEAPTDTQQAIASANANAHVSENIVEIDTSKKFYVSLGICKSEEEAKNLIDILKSLGKIGNLASHSLGFMVYMGPFISRSQAQTEVESIELSTSLTASIVRTIN